MMSSKKLLKMATKWQRLEASNKKRISPCKVIDNANEHSSTTTSTSPSKADRGQFVVYSYDQRRFTIPLHFLNNEVFVQLLNMSEEEFGLPSDGPIVLPVDSQLLNYIITVVQRGLTRDVREALLMSVDMNYRCTLPSSYQEWKNEHLPVH